MREQTVQPPVVRLKTERLNRGLSRREAANSMGIDRRTLERAERGEPLHPRPAKLIADFYGVLVTDIWPVDEAA